MRENRWGRVSRERGFGIMIFSIIVRVKCRLSEAMRDIWESSIIRPEQRHVLFDAVSAFNIDEFIALKLKANTYCTIKMKTKMKLKIEFQN